MNLKILNTIGEVYTEEAKAVLGSFGAMVDYKTLTQAGLKDIVSQYDVLLVGLGLNINKEIIEKGKKLKVIATATTGLDHIDVKAAGENGIHVLSLRDEHDFLDTVTSTAELALSLMLNLCRHILPAVRSVASGGWDSGKFRGRSLFGKTLGIVGMGRLGKMMARYGLALGMRVIFYDPNIAEIPNQGCGKVSFNTLLERSDVVSIHVHLKDDTLNMFHAEVFEKMKTGVLIVNTSRGKIVNEIDMIAALKSSKVGGYAADVLSGEADFGNNIPADNALLEYSRENQNVIITPHIGGVTHESRSKTDVFIAQKLVGVLSKSPALSMP